MVPDDVLLELVFRFDELMLDELLVFIGVVLVALLLEFVRLADEVGVVPLLSLVVPVVSLLYVLLLAIELLLPVVVSLLLAEVVSAVP